MHHFIDDYQFQREWSRPKLYAEMLARFDYVTSPDFSTYSDFPMALQIWNHYRKHWLGAYFQAHGVRVIPTISWSTPESFKWCFDGEPKGSTVAVSSVGCRGNLNAFLLGYDTMLDRLAPKLVLFHGDPPEGVKGNIVRIPAFQDKWKRREVNGR